MTSHPAQEEDAIAVPVVCPCLLLESRHQAVGTGLYVVVYGQQHMQPKVLGMTYFLGPNTIARR